MTYLKIIVYSPHLDKYIKLQQLTNTLVVHTIFSY